jgi:hypothetical protein
LIIENYIVFASLEQQKGLNSQTEHSLAVLLLTESRPSLCSPETTGHKMKNKGILMGSLLASAVLAAESADPPSSQVDRVGFPKDYATTYHVVRTTNKATEGKVVTVFANDLAASVTNATQRPYPYGSIIVMETAAARKDALGKLVVDEKGAIQRDTVLGLHVMRREKGFGAGYGPNRSGEWEYVEYRPDGSWITPPEKSASCAKCHIQAGAERDFVYRGRFGSD